MTATGFGGRPGSGTTPGSTSADGSAAVLPARPWHGVRVEDDAGVLLFGPHHEHATVTDHLEAELSAMT